MVVGARRAVVSISETTDLLRFPNHHHLRGGDYRKWSQKEEVSSEQQMCGPKRLVDVSGQRKMVATRGTSKKMGCSSRRAHQVPMLSAENRKMRLQFTQTQQNWTIEDWENVAGLTSLDFRCDAPNRW